MYLTTNQLSNKEKRIMKMHKNLTPYFMINITIFYGITKVLGK